VARKEDKRCAYIILMWRSAEKRLLGRPSCGWEENIKVDQELIWVGN
jgi:hypothetical protein